MNNGSKFIEQLAAAPKKIFLADAGGAALSAFMLGVVLVKFNSLFGIPIPALYLLAFIPCLFIIYDLFCYFFIERRLGFFIKGIAAMNFCYCILSLGFAIYHRSELTYLGWAYIVGEILIILGVVFLEMKVAGEN